MNRFAFRAWDAQEGRILSWQDIQKLSARDLFLSGKYDVMQWIGEYDKNGCPIYEGDYIAEKINKEEQLYTVNFSVRQARFVTKPLNTEIKCRPCLNRGTTKILSVKGNIYETSKISKYGYKSEAGRADMKRLKFRKWSGTDKRMIPWEDLLAFSVRDIFNQKDCTARNMLQQTDCSVMQWTGCSGGRGEPIYEGDIIVDVKDKHKNPYIIYWGGGGIGFSAKPIFPNVYIAPSIEAGNSRLKQIAIIGNVKETPDIARYQKLEDIYEENKPPITENRYNPCLFCGGDNVDLECDDGIWYVRCEDCGAQGSTAYMPENAIAIWNNENTKGGRA